MTGKRGVLATMHKFGDHYHHTVFYIAIVVTLVLILQIIAMAKGIW